MLAYNARVAVKSIKRNPLLSAIVVTGIALGICATTTFTTVRHMFARDPLPGRSHKSRSGGPLRFAVCAGANRATRRPKRRCWH